MPPLPVALLSLLALVFGACSSLPDNPPPLADMEEPLALQKEPDDETARTKLDPGSFSGIYVKSAWFTEPLEPDQEPDALEIARIVENSPAARAGLRKGDLLLTAQTGAGAATKLTWPSQWRKLEVATAPGTKVRLTFDRANAVRRTELALIPRVAAPVREKAERFREEQRTGIVVRTATEVEARAAGLGAGGGAVLIGMSARSPLRQSKLQFRDVLVRIGETEIHHPQVLLSAIRAAESDADLELEFVRNGARHTTKVQTSQREREVTSLSLPPLLSYEFKRGESDLSVLLGLFSYTGTRAASEWGFLWFFSFTTGDSDRLEEVKR